MGALIRIGGLHRPCVSLCLCCLGCASVLLPLVSVHLSHTSAPRVGALVRNDPNSPPPTTLPVSLTDRDKMKINKQRAQNDLLLSASCWILVVNSFA